MKSELPSKQTLFTYFRFKRCLSNSKLDISKVPEVMVTNAVKNLITGDGPIQMKPSGITLNMSDIPWVCICILYLNYYFLLLFYSSTLLPSSSEIISIHNRYSFFFI